MEALEVKSHVMVALHASLPFYAQKFKLYITVLDRHHS